MAPELNGGAYRRFPARGRFGSFFDFVRTLCNNRTMKTSIQKAASALAHKRWDNTSAEERARVNKMLQEARAKKRLARKEKLEDEKNT